MNFIDVNSSTIKRIGYAQSNLTLVIEFQDNSIYEYYSVPESVYISLISASSKGSFLHQNIKNKFKFSKIK